jgi:prevent-host-death family protein
MHVVGTFEAKTNLSGLLDQVEQGEQIVITKHGKPIARLMPMVNIDRELIHNTINQLKTFSKHNKLNGLDRKELRDGGKK